jgi:hypothetical protein
MEHPANSILPPRTPPRALSAYSALEQYSALERDSVLNCFLALAMRRWEETPRHASKCLLGLASALCLLSPFPTARSPAPSLVSS